MRAGDVDVVGLGEAVAEGHSAGDKIRVEAGSCGRTCFQPFSHFFKNIVFGCLAGFLAGTGVIDEDVNVPWTGLDLLGSLLVGLVTGEVQLDCLDGAG